MNHILHYTASSHTGLIRKNNEDAAYAGARLLALADGMGGHIGGEIASHCVISHLEQLDADEPTSQALSQLETAVQHANRELARLIEEHPELYGMGTTLTAILFTGSQIALCHIGDSRAYLFRHGLTRLTHDDTIVQLLVDAGQLRKEEVFSHPQKSILHKALTGDYAAPTLSLIDIQLGDKILLCSDGVTDVVSDETISAILAEDTDVETLSRALVNAALNQGGPDNISVVLAQVEEGILPRDQPILAGSLLEESPYLLPVTSPFTFSFIRQWYNHRLYRYCALIVTLLLFSAALTLFYLWKNNFYVGAEDNNLVIYQGIDTGSHFFHHKYSDICVTRQHAHVRTIQFSFNASTPCHHLRLDAMSNQQKQSVHDLPRLNSLSAAEKQIMLLMQNPN